LGNPSSLKVRAGGIDEVASSVLVVVPSGELGVKVGYVLLQRKASLSDVQPFKVLGPENKPLRGSARRGGGLCANLRERVEIVLFTVIAELPIHRQPVGWIQVETDISEQALLVDLVIVCCQLVQGVSCIPRVRERVVFRIDVQRVGGRSCQVEIFWSNEGTVEGVSPLSLLRHVRALPPGVKARNLDGRPLPNVVPKIHAEVAATVVVKLPDDTSLLKVLKRKGISQILLRGGQLNVVRHELVSPKESLLIVKCLSFVRIVDHVILSERIRGARVKITLIALTGERTIRPLAPMMVRSWNLVRKLVCAKLVADRNASLSCFSGSLLGNHLNYSVSGERSVERCSRSTLDDLNGFDILHIDVLKRALCDRAVHHDERFLRSL